MWLMKRNCLIYLVQFYKTLTELRETEQTHISYNFIMTLNYMLMIPRSKGKYGGDENKDEDKDKDKLGLIHVDSKD